MNDFVNDLVQKPVCSSIQTALREKEKAVLSEMHCLADKYGDRFHFDGLLLKSGEFSATCANRIVVSLQGPPIRRYLKYPEICPFGIEEDHVIYLLSSLPPITMIFYLTGQYPTDSTFAFSLESAWLPRDMMDLLSLRLSAIISDKNSGPSLTTCCNFLQYEAIAFLFGAADSQAFSIDTYQILDTPLDRHHFTDMLVGFEEDVKDNEFELCIFECPVCFDQVEGKKCIRLMLCQDVFCIECASRSFCANIIDGTNSGSPVCPSCGRIVRPQEIKRVVDANVYALYESQLLKRTLSSMKDVVECPEMACKYSHVLLENDFSHGICPACRFHFCALCRYDFHEGVACAAGPTANLSPAEISELVGRYNNAGADGRAQLELEFGKLNINKLIEENASYHFVDTNCKKCPKCKSSIEAS